MQVRKNASRHSNSSSKTDLKPENVLFDDDGHIRLTDFGLANQKALDDTSQRVTSCGTPLYMPPEALNSQRSGYGLEVVCSYNFFIVAATK